MLLQFPDITTLTLAISSGTIPETVVSSPLDYASGEDGKLWVEAEGSLPQSVSSTLKNWGVSVHRGRGKLKLVFRRMRCWLEVVPLERIRQSEMMADRTQVLFELREESLLPELVNEMLRLGNDRQSFRRVIMNEEPRILLRVIGAPYYSLLRASDNWTDPSAIRAYVETSPRVWIASGYRHPFGNRLVPAPGEHLLVNAAGEWISLAEQPFQDVYSVMEFRLPEQSERLTDVGTVQKLQVPLRLSRSTGQESAEVIVLTKDALGQLERFVQSSSDGALERMAFAVVEGAAGTEHTVVVRIRPGRTPAPVLIFDGLACRNFLKIPNLFVPLGLRIHPPLRRDAVRELLAADESRLVWLAPIDATDAEANAGRPLPFVARSVPDSAFLPMSNWVDYVLDYEREPLSEWRNSHQFQFEEFICKAESSGPKLNEAPVEKPKKKSSGPKATASQESQTESKKTLMDRLIAKFRRSATDPVEDAEAVRLRAKLSEVEARFLELETQLDDPARGPMWLEMADLNAALDRFADSSICRQHQFWDAESPETTLLELWFHTDAQGAVRLGSTGLVNSSGVVTDRELRRLFRAAMPSPAEAAQITSWLVWAVRTDEGRALVRNEQAEILQFLEKYESCMAVRACWMAWSAMAALNDDVLMLARARDRILERMYQHGLTADRDIPSFLRLGTGQSGEQIRQVREEFKNLHQTVRAWSSMNLGIASAQTLQYIDLTFAYGFAKLGEVTTASELIHSAEKELLQKKDAVHRWLFDAYRHRIETTIAGQPATGAFPDKFMKRLESLDRLDRYKIDRLRQHSCILEPVEQLDPYREWRRREEGDLQKELADLFVEIDRSKLSARIASLLERKLSVTERAQVLTTALELSTRLGEKYAAGLLAQVTVVDQKLSDPILRAQLLEKGLLIGAHYGEAAAVHDCFGSMSALLQSLKNADVVTLEAMEKLLSRSFMTLRKMGMRNEIAFLLEAMSKVVRDSLKSAGTETERLRVLLQLAGGWFYFGQDRGWKDIDVARELLLGGSLIDEGHVGTKKQTDLAISYIRAVGQAPLRDAVDRLNDLFENLTGIRDGQTVSSHYSLKHLDIVEAFVQTIVSDSFTMDKSSQRWMDDEEFLIRRRIHRDLRKMMKD